MASSDEIIKAVSALGIGTSIGAVVTAVVNTRASKGKSRAEAADLLIGAAERVGKINADQDVEIRRLKRILDDMHVLILDHLDGRVDKAAFAAALKKMWEVEK